MKFSTLCLVAGNELCNARCPFCIAKMTPARALGKTKPVVDWRNFKKAASLARKGGVSSVMITGKGEPTLFPEQISDYLRALQEFNFEFIDLQTNGLLFIDQRQKYETYLKEWYDLGLTTIALSVTHYLAERNREIYSPNRSAYISLPKLIDLLHEHHFTARLVCIMLKDYIDSAAEISKLIEFSRQNEVEQLSLQPVNIPNETRNSEVARWTTSHRLSSEQLTESREYICSSGRMLMTLPNGGALYDITGQNVCLTNCLTLNTNYEKLRQLIFFPNGNVAFDWQFEGALLLRGRYTQTVKKSLSLAA